MPSFLRAVRSTLGVIVRERLIRRLLPWSVTSNLNRNDREGAIYRAWGHVYTNHLAGGYYEFGVYKGERLRAAIQLQQIFARWAREQSVSAEPWRRTAIARYQGFQHEFYAFDTFQGMPDNAEGNRNFAAGNFRCTLEEVKRLNRRAGIREGPHLRYFVGRFDEVARRDAEVIRQLQPAAIVNLDCDLYESAVDALALVAPKLIQGSVLLVDDWNTFEARQEKGERRAIREFLARHPDWSLDPWFTYEFSGQAFLVHRPDAPAAAAEEFSAASAQAAHALARTSA